jgi:hypothetical protein
VLLGEIVVRLGLAGFLAWVGTTDPDQGLVLLLCGLAALYHLFVAARLASFRLAGATGLTLESDGLTIRQLWRDRRIAWASVTGIELRPARPLAGQRAGLILILGDRKGPTETLAIPDVFEPGPHQLLVEMEHRRGGHG